MAVMKNMMTTLMAPIVWLVVVVTTLTFLGLGLVAQSVMQLRPAVN